MGSLFSRENSSNGGLVHRNFLPESYEPEKRGVKKILGIKYLYFQHVTKNPQEASNCSKMIHKCLFGILTAFN